MREGEVWEPKRRWFSSTTDLKRTSLAFPTVSSDESSHHIPEHTKSVPGDVPCWAISDAFTADLTLVEPIGVAYSKSIKKYELSGVNRLIERSRPILSDYWSTKIEIETD